MESRRKNQRATTTTTTSNDHDDGSFVAQTETLTSELHTCEQVLCALAARLNTAWQWPQERGRASLKSSASLSQDACR